MQHLNQTLDDAIRTYLGGDYENGAIQIGLRSERLLERFGDNAVALQSQIEQILKSTFDQVISNGDKHLKQSIY